VRETFDSERFIMKSEGKKLGEGATRATGIPLTNFFRFFFDLETPRGSGPAVPNSHSLTP